MIIDFQKYIADKLPVRLQRFLNVEIIRVLIIWVVKGFNDFYVKIPDWLYKANANASVLSLQHHIKREFDVEAIITELDGKPIDFLVTINGFVDETALKNFIKKWSLAGKSFVFKIGAVAFTAKFDNYICENIIETYTAKFSEHVCEDNRQVNITVDVVPVDVDYKVIVTASKAVQSNISVQVVAFYPDNHPVIITTIVLEVGSAGGEELFALGIQAGLDLPLMASKNVTSDEYYDYNLIY